MLFEEISWRQKSRMIWLKEGDKIQSFSIRLMNLHCRINTIGLLAMDGKAFTNQAEGYSNSN